MKDLINIFKLLGIAAWLLAAIGGVGYCAYFGHYIIAAAVLFLAIVSYPTVLTWLPGKPPEK